MVWGPWGEGWSDAFNEAVPLVVVLFQVWKRQTGGEVNHYEVRPERTPHRVRGRPGERRTGDTDRTCDGGTMLLLIQCLYKGAS